MSKVVKIKKYGNRRFYSSDEKKYITISDIQRSIAKGYKVQILDADTDKDITADILTQILLEQGRATHFPVELLEQMIRTSEKSLNSVWAPLMAQQFKIMTQMGEMALQSFKAMLNPLERASTGAGEKEDKSSVTASMKKSKKS